MAPNLYPVAVYRALKTPAALLVLYLFLRATLLAFTAPCGPPGPSASSLSPSSPGGDASAASGGAAGATAALCWAAPSSVWGWVRAYWLVVLTFLTFLYAYENVLSTIQGPRRLSLADDYVTATPPRVEPLEAFVYDTPMNTYERAKMVFFTVTGILPLRLLVFAVSLPLAMSSVVAGAAWPSCGPWVWLWTNVGIAWATLALAAVGVYHVREYGEHADRSAARAIVGNHSCAIEVMLLFIFARFPSFVSARENLRVAVMGGVVRACDAVLVDRDRADSRQATQAAIDARLRDATARQLLVFPEGTTANQRTLYQFKKGVFEAGVPVQMVCVAFPYKHFNPAWTGRAVGGSNASDVLLRLASQFVTYAELRALPPYTPTEAERADPIAYAAHCQAMMAAVLRENVSDATTHDYKRAAELYAASKKGGAASGGGSNTKVAATMAKTVDKTE